MSFKTELWIGQDGIFTRTDEKLRDLSVGGAFVECHQVYPIGSVLNFRFKLPGLSTFVSCSGIVRNMLMGQGFGVEFLDLSRDNAGIIERKIAENISPSIQW